MKLSGLLPTLPDRLAYAKKAKLPELDFLELVLQDEVDRRDHKNLEVRLSRAGFEEDQTLEGFDWDAPVTFDRDRIKELFSLGFIERREDVIFLGPVGVGKTFLACALGHAACRAGHDVRFLRADHLFQSLHQARADYTTEKVLRRLLAPDLLILDDFGLRRLTAELERGEPHAAAQPLVLHRSHLPRRDPRGPSIRAHPSGQRRENLRFLERFKLSLDARYMDDFEQASPRLAEASRTIGNFLLVNARLGYELPLPGDRVVPSCSSPREPHRYGRRIQTGYPMPGINGMIGATVSF